MKIIVRSAFIGVCLILISACQNATAPNGAGTVPENLRLAFDEEDETLAGVKDGSIYATVGQQPFEFGYQAIRMMRDYLKGEKSAIPASNRCSYLLL